MTWRGCWWEWAISTNMSRASCFEWAEDEEQRQCVVARVALGERMATDGFGQERHRNLRSGGPDAALSDGGREGE